MNLKDKKIFVTGGTRGIGRSIVQKFYNSGGDVMLTGAKFPSSNLYTQEKFKKFDFSEMGDIYKCVDAIKAFSPDILINNAGINIIRPFEEISANEFLNIQQVNVLAPLMLMQAASDSMKRKGWGRVVNISSIFGLRSKSFRASYSASKFALDGLTVAYAAEFAKYGILANSVAPGFIKTDMTDKILGSRGIEEISSSIPMGRLGKSDEVANLVCWLASEENSYITGQNIVIDGGVNRVHC
jgi:3-oxoacyl-[acyl-carrier protein] reductase